MDNYEYLKHISQSNRPDPSAKKLNAGMGLIIKILVGGIFATILLIGLGLLINGNSTSPTDRTRQLYTRIENVNTLIKDYNNSIKSSQLRAINYSLSGVLTGTSTQLSNYFQEANSGSNSNDTTLPDKLSTIETNLYESTNAKLTDAKLNGMLDRIYIAQIHMQISLLMTLTGEILQNNLSSSLREILDSFYSNLRVIEQSVDNYSS